MRMALHGHSSRASPRQSVGARGAASAGPARRPGPDAGLVALGARRARQRRRRCRRPCAPGARRSAGERARLAARQRRCGSGGGGGRPQRW